MGRLHLGADGASWDPFEKHREADRRERGEA